MRWNRIMYRSLSALVAIIALWSFIVGAAWIAQVEALNMTFVEKLIPITKIVVGIVWLAILVVVGILLYERGGGLMTGYKLFRVKANGDITSLFIDKSKALPLDEWMDHENHPTKGFKERPGWHCCRVPAAPHLSEKGRAWYRVDIEDYEIHVRPRLQGGIWFTANRMKILELVG